MKKKPINVLFIFPSLFMQTSLPLGISSLSAALSQNGINVKTFDTASHRFSGEVDENIERARFHHSFKPVNYESVGISESTEDLYTSFQKVLDSFQPDLIALSAIESTFERGVQLLRFSKKTVNVPTIVGGIFPTLSPDIAILENSIDMICIGEGEGPLLKLCECIAQGEDYSNIQSIWSKKDGQIKKNDLMPLASLDDMISPDFSSFRNEMFYRPMQGNLFKTLPIEFARGCPYKCAFCSERKLSVLYKNNYTKQSYFRRKSLKNVITEIEKGIDLYNPNFFYFASETFLAMSESDFSLFIDAYKNIKVPFWIQTRVETITYERVKKLKDVGLYWMTMGIEHGNENFRKKMLNRRTKNAEIINVIKTLDQLDQGASLNSIIGFPLETKPLIYDTIFLNRDLYKENKRIRANISIYTPFRGSQLYDFCVENDLFKPVPFLSETNFNNDESLLKSKDITNNDIKGLYRTFPLYIYLADEYLEKIKQAEKISDHGDQIYNELIQKIKNI